MGSHWGLQNRGVIWSDLLTRMVPQVPEQGMPWEKQKSTNPGTFGRSIPHRNTGCQTFLLEMNLKTGTTWSWQPELDWNLNKEQTISEWFSMSLRCRYPRGRWLLYPGYHHRSLPTERMAGDGTRCFLPEGLTFKKRVTPPDRWVFKKPRSPRSQARERLVLKKNYYYHWLCHFK